MTAQESPTRPFSAKLTVDDFVLLDRSGAFDAYAKTELIEGRVFAVNTTMSEHFVTATRFFRRLADACDALDRGVEAWAEGSIDVPPHTVPRPDMFVTRSTPAPGLAKIETVLLVVEIASTTLAQDLTRKRAVYARAGIPEYWVVDVKGRIMHQMWTPLGDVYAERREIAFGDRMTAETVAGLTVPSASL